MRLGMQEEDAQHPAGERDDMGVNFPRVAPIVAIPLFQKR